MNEHLNLTDYEPIGEANLYKKVLKVFGTDFVSGLPCGELRGFIEASNNNADEVGHIQATNENEAAAIAQGASLAGKKPALYMQNSGLLKITNEIGSLLIPCQTEALFIASWRGAPGEEATQHLATGAATIPVIEALGLPYIVGATLADLKKLKASMERSKLPGVILMKKEKFNQGVELTQRVIEAERAKGDWHKERSGLVTLSREEALNIIFSNLITDKDGVFSSTGLISRSIFHHHDAPNQFYNAGAFGFTSSIALGYAINAEHRVITIEGDGSVLTNLGALNTIGHHGTDNFVHVVLDNATYASCSAEQTYGSDKIPEVALTFGYKRAFTVQSREQLLAAIAEINKNNNGPQMLHIQINSEGQRDFKRPLGMADITNRFRNYFQ